MPQPTLTKSKGERYTDTEMLDALRHVSDDIGHEPSQAEYREHPVGPSVPTLWSRFGGWSAAKEKAGVGGNMNTSDVNSQYFEDIDSAEKSYWLGLMYADGCVTTYGDEGLVAKLTLSEQDGHTVEAFKDAVDAEYAVSPIHKKDGQHDQLSIAIRDTEFCEYLKAHGVVQRKTHKDTFPELSEEFRPAFIRGYFDGDGTFGINSGRYIANWSITGASEERISSIYSWLQNIGVEGGSFFETGRKYYVIAIKSEGDIQTLWESLYPSGRNTEPSMNRKTQKIANVVEVI